MNLRGQDSTSMIDVKNRAAQYAKIASFVNADPDEIGKTLAKQPTQAKASI
jgi:cell division septal protein FtsQ